MRNRLEVFEVGEGGEVEEEGVEEVDSKSALLYSVFFPLSCVKVVRGREKEGERRKRRE